MPSGNTFLELLKQYAAADIIVLSLLAVAYYLDYAINGPATKKKRITAISVALFYFIASFAFRHFNLYKL